MPVCSWFLFYSYAAHRHLHSFPTRRSSDLLVRALKLPDVSPDRQAETRAALVRALEGVAELRDALERARSEEHTSELQSHSDLVCRLLLEKKKKISTALITDHGTRTSYLQA